MRVFPQAAASLPIFISFSDIGFLSPLGLGSRYVGKLSLSPIPGSSQTANQNVRSITRCSSKEPINFHRRGKAEARQAQRRQTHQSYTQKQNPGRHIYDSPPPPTINFRHGAPSRTTTTTAYRQNDHQRKMNKNNNHYVYHDKSEPCRMTSPHTTPRTRACNNRYHRGHKKRATETTPQRTPTPLENARKGDVYGRP